MAPFANEAAWLPTANARPVQVGPGPTPNPAENEVVIKVAYAAVNPADWKLQDNPNHLTYPFIYGEDIAGTIVQLGSKVTQFKLGQRVLGHCDGLLTQKAANSGFQLYSTCIEHLVSPVADSLPLANAVVLPIGVDTAATALYAHHKLALPSLNPVPTGKKVLLWGGSSSVGSCGIQLAVASGLEVVTTASRSNHDYVKSLGATHVFDYNEANVINQILEVLRPGDYVVDCISTNETATTCGKIVEKIGGGKLPVVDYGVMQTTYPENVEASMVICLDPGHVQPDIGDYLWHKFIPEALAAGKFQAKPDPHLIKGGLAKVQDGIDLLRKGVSATKVVIEISAE